MVRRVMAGKQSPQHPEEPSGANAGWAAVGYLIAGMGVWGFVGWLVDIWLDTGGIATAIGIVVGTACGVYLIARRAGA